MGSSTERITSVEYHKPYRPFFIRLFNLAGRISTKLRITSADLKSELILSKARKKTKLSDLGDAVLMNRMNILVNSLQKQACLHPFGRFVARQTFVRLLSNRLRIEDYFHRYPEIFEIDVDNPVIITGLQRTGTTMLHRLLSLDTSFRFLTSWEAINPAPFREKSTNGKDPRIKMAVRSQKALKYMAPDFFAIHPIDAHGPEEDCLLFDVGFWGTAPEALYRIPDFSSWLENQDHTDAYLFFKKILQFLMWQRPGRRWLLKTPQHMEHLDVLFRVFPKAKIIQTHRHPLKTVASFCSMISHAYGVLSDDVDPIALREHWMRKNLIMVDRSIKMREGSESSNFTDVFYHDLVANPILEIEKIYDFLGMDLDGEIKDHMKNWIKRNPKNRYGKHQYHLDHFNLDRNEVEETFHHYISYFDIQSEE